MMNEIKVILHIIKRESEEQIDRLENVYPDEMQEMIEQHRKKINELSTEEEIDAWLKQYRGVSLEEWYETL